MGAIASVLQWNCGQCSLINPTERVKCLRCGLLRDNKFYSDPTSALITNNYHLYHDNNKHDTTTHNR